MLKTAAAAIALTLAAAASQAAPTAADLFDLTRAVHPGRGGPEEVTLFKSVGTALEDLAAATLVATRQGLLGE